MILPVEMVACAAALAAMAGPGGVRDPIMRTTVPEDGRIRITDHGYRDWGPELVHYTVDTRRFRPGRLVLMGPAGAAVPFQIDGNTLAFVASVPKGQRATYTLASSAADRSAENTTLKCATAGEVLEVATEHLALRLPAPGETTFAEPAKAGKARPPMLAWSCAGGDWIGGARLATPRKLAAQSFRIVRTGPACAEYEARYRFAPRGEYLCRIRLAGGMPLAVVTEDFDLGEVSGGEDLLALDLHARWKPTTVAWTSGQGEQQVPPLFSSPMAEYLDRRRKAAPQVPPVGGAGVAPAPVVPEKGFLLLEKIAPAGKWGGYVGGVQVSDGTPAAAGGPARAVAWVPLFAGSWRRTMAVNVWLNSQGGITVGLPISVRHMRWSLDIADDFSPFSTHEHDRDLPATYGRRVWGLSVSPDLRTAQAQFGYIGLDRYKDWILDWPEPAAAAAGGKAGAYPGAFFLPAHVERIRKTLDQHPDGEFLKTWHLFSGKTEDAIRHARLVIGRLGNKPDQENDFFLVGLSGYRKSQFLTFVHRAEDALACPALPADLRRELRLRLALYAHVMSEPDLNPRGAGVHLGNNNMSINRTLALTYFAGLLGDHPRYAYWMDQVRLFVQYKLATQTAQCGPFIECPSYQTYSPLRTLNISQIVLRNRGVADFIRDGYHARTLQYLADLTMPDARLAGRRIIPGMGNSSNLPENVWGFCMAPFADKDPQFAGWLRYINRLANPVSQSFEKGPNYHDKDTPHALFFLPDVAENPQPLKTEFVPGYGVMFRAHFGNPRETAMLFRAGMNWSHWDCDYLNVILYGQGAPLSPGTGYQYYSGPALADNAIYHNQVKVGRRDLPEVFGRVDATVADYGFGEQADYAVADRYYPPELFAPPAGDGRGEMRWRRHVMFLKSPVADGPSYFVMRDTFGGEVRRPKWWTWMNLGAADRIAVDGRPFDKDAVALDRVVPQEQFPRLGGQVVQMKTDYGASTWLWSARPWEVRARMTFSAPASGLPGGKEIKTILDVPAAAEEDFHYVLFPLRDGAEPPRCRALAAGILRVETAESRDVVFAGDVPFAWDAEDVIFTGKAGAVRIFADRAALCLNAGSGQVGYKGFIFEGPGPFERVVKLADLKPGVTRVEGYEKKPITLDLGSGVKVTGEGPLEARLDGQTIRLRTSGRARVVHITQPPFIIRPQYYVDGQEWMACWTDYPASGWGTYKNTWLIGLSVPAGDHELLVKNMTFPSAWTRQFEPMLGTTAPRK